ncbi:hypothetical protein M6B38_329125 [Iris pallida]|uniref:Uncharacterized protein n=1 Tax=Iris pallida TaxID=29817 RepID=A0AAX6FUY9_IRIPA|nr:hypothetical protein M6B38_399135 [Iris pallida]KAJ6836112.1 hypothetical protein M6B38_329125 [Iris pallida]
MKASAGMRFSGWTWHQEMICRGNRGEEESYVRLWSLTVNPKINFSTLHSTNYKIYYQYFYRHTRFSL